MIRRFALMLVLALAATAYAADVDPLNVMEARTFAAPNGVKLLYRLLQPLNYDAAKSYPLVLVLHGSGGRGDDNRQQIADQPIACAKLANEPLRSAFPCFVVAPQCPKTSTWSRWRDSKAGYTPEMAAVRALLGALPREFNIDAQRLYVTGLSMGGFGTCALLTGDPFTFAAAVPVCGAGNPDLMVDAVSVPMRVYHGTDDSAVPVAMSRRMVSVLNTRGGSLYYKEYPKTGHDSWLKAYAEADLWPWLFAQRRQPAGERSVTASSLK
ncbi:MAG: phospholipase [Armatimonadetes bacterium]|nr:phospholipase [Armatimonadota bacterium]